MQRKVASIAPALGSFLRGLADVLFMRFMCRTVYTPNCDRFFVSQVWFETQVKCVSTFMSFAIRCSSCVSIQVSTTLDKVQMATEEYFAGIRRTVFSFDEVSTYTKHAADAAADSCVIYCVLLGNNQGDYCCFYGYCYKYCCQLLTPHWAKLHLATMRDGARKEIDRVCCRRRCD